MYIYIYTENIYNSMYVISISYLNWGWFFVFFQKQIAKNLVPGSPGLT